MPSVDVEEDDIAALGGEEEEEEEQDDGPRFKQKQMTTEVLTASLDALEPPAAVDSAAFAGAVVDQGSVLAIDPLQNAQAELASVQTATKAKAKGKATRKRKRQRSAANEATGKQKKT